MDVDALELQVDGVTRTFAEWTSDFVDSHYPNIGLDCYRVPALHFNWQKLSKYAGGYPEQLQLLQAPVQVLDGIFPNGSAYTLGRINKDCWYLYTLEDEGVTRPDQIIELLMWDMCQDRMKFFTKGEVNNSKAASQKSGITDIIPGMQLDDVLFEPCGYSMNGLLPDGCYITIHVTPEPHCSFVSFESNVPQETYHDMVEKVLDVFSPGHFLMTIFANKASIARDTHKTLEHQDQIKGYSRNDHQLCLFKNYTLTYTQYSKTKAKSPTTTSTKPPSFPKPVI